MSNTPDFVRIDNSSESFRCECGATITRKTFKGNWKCPRCKTVYDPTGRVIFVKSMRI